MRSRPPTVRTASARCSSTSSAIVADQGEDPELLRLDRVLDRRRGHPLVVAAVGAELLRRAGIAAAVCSSPTRWFVGIRDPHSTVLLDARLSAHDDPAPSRVRRHCPHEVAFCVLTGLAERFVRRIAAARAPRARPAARATGRRGRCGSRCSATSTRSAPPSSATRAAGGAGPRRSRPARAS